MEIILLKDIDKVGDKHTVVKVKDGYGRNFLIPQGLALEANKKIARNWTTSSHAKKQTKLKK